ncbi:MAG TPA: ABC transporter substrate-binding protein [Steroidobacteraceae bacterium]|nr:ABC transporter substrate-binding protein [Steroidobacteraceae bacterium]
MMRLAISTLALLLASGTALAQDKPAAGQQSSGQQSAAAGQAAEPGPAELIEESAQEMLDELEKNRAEYRKDPAKVRALVDRVLLPHFDTQYSARLVLGKHWRTAQPDQRERFVDAFYNSLLDNYGAALVEFTGDRMRVLPVRVAPDAERAVVRTEVRRNNGTRIPVNYSLRRTPQGWKAWDVSIEGISYVKSFREDFGSEIEQKGLDVVIRRLESGEKPRSRA